MSLSKDMRASLRYAKDARALRGNIVVVSIKTFKSWVDGVEALELAFKKETARPKKRR